MFPLVAGIWLALLVSWGHEGGAAKKEAKDYWRKNLATYRDAKVPDIHHVTLDLDLFPEQTGISVRGKYMLINLSDQPLDEILLTGGPHWEKLTWTMDGKPVSPIDRAHLFVFTPPGGALRPARRWRSGSSTRGRIPRGISKRGGGSPEFILPSSVVLTSFRPTHRADPRASWTRSVIDDENRQDPKEFRDDFYKGQTDSFVGARAPFSTKITITGPADFTINSVGTKTAETVKDGRRTVVWESDFPVSFFNVIAGRWEVERGEGTAIYYHAGHPYNIAEMREALDAARRYYSEWFYPYPWQELKLSEFPNLATYAQGFPTNITFSEGIGFLTSSTPENHAAFEITSHEAAHQWWGNILSPGKGPGGNILSEGMSHFSTILLVEQVKGLQSRIDFCKRLEASYGKESAGRLGAAAGQDRPANDPAIRPSPMTRGAGSSGCCLNQMGRDRALAGMRAFIKTYQGNPDHPVLQDFVAAMRPFAADPTAFDAFTQPVVLTRSSCPSISLHDAKKTCARRDVGGDRPGRECRLRRDARRGRGHARRAVRQGRLALARLSRGPRRRSCWARASRRTSVITCPFEPEQVVVDPDAKVLQLRRKNAVAKF